MASETRLQGAELTEVGWGPGAQTGGGPQSWRGAGAEGVPERRPGPAARLRFDSQPCHLLAA